MNTDERRARAILATMSADLEGVKPWEDLGAIQTEAMMKIARAIRASDEAAGMVMVPRVATDAILTAGIQAWWSARDSSHGNAMRAAWSAMLAAGGDDADV